MSLDKVAGRITTQRSLWGSYSKLGGKGLCSATKCRCPADTPGARCRCVYSVGMGLKVWLETVLNLNRCGAADAMSTPHYLANLNRNPNTNTIPNLEPHQTDRKLILTRTQISPLSRRYQVHNISPLPSPNIQLTTPTHLRVVSPWGAGRHGEH